MNMSFRSSARMSWICAGPPWRRLLRRPLARPARQGGMPIADPINPREAPKVNVYASFSSDSVCPKPLGSSGSSVSAHRVLSHGSGFTMWARRCGAPPLWPSRVRVFVQSLFPAAVGYAVYRFMTAADVGYLDVGNPTSETVLCLTDWPLRHDARSWLETESWADWKELVLDETQYIEEHECPVSASGSATCSDLRIPVQDLQRRLGYPFGVPGGLVSSTTIIETYSHGFVYLGAILWLTIVAHDLALLSVKNNNYILDLRGTRKYFPRLARMVYLSGFQYFLRWVSGGGFGMKHRFKGLGRCCAILLAPVFLAWGVLFFIMVWWPSACLTFLFHPVKLSRVGVFTTCILMSVLGVALAAHTLALVSSKDYRPLFALTWFETASSCTCGCVFPLAATGLQEILLLAVAMVTQVLFLAFRCLKGLRRSNWASLLSVKFSVPLNAYPTEWTAPDGNPVANRKEGQPVQGELAFDPFALMDEQPESAMTRVKLLPTLCEEEVGRRASLREERQRTAATLRGPTGVSAEAIREQRIGCCGFPCGTAEDAESPKSTPPRSPARAAAALEGEAEDPAAV
ncbi:unnamed protein product [Prorocentrum cordatum]|uniref:Transmembrane protein n=1 Tax=Prorocentrum cordatum TaxID=2364126 RepID=A0ABN9V5K5_9DINO|nr:unnamed protein product [Polarella glacialis]